jgi:Flp pilus assembly pilin Flp
VDALCLTGAAANGGHILIRIFHWAKLRQDCAGVTAAEYALLFAVMGGLMMAATWLLGNAVGSQMNNQVALFASSAGTASSSSSSSTSSTGGSSSTTTRA